MRLSEETRDALLISLMIFLVILSVFLGLMIVIRIQEELETEFVREPEKGVWRIGFLRPLSRSSFQPLRWASFSGGLSRS